MVNYDLIIQWCDIAILIAYVVMLFTFWYYIVYFLLCFKKPKKYPKGTKNYKFCVIIPARNECNVIENNLISLKKQTYPKDKYDVYVIVESKDDPTCKITKKLGYNFYIRKDLVNKGTKGFAIREFIEDLKVKGINANYDAYMIFDADNRMDSNYLERMNNLKNAGYQVGFGYRNFSNANKNYVTINSAVLFATLNGIFSKGRSIVFDKIMLNGTGYYIDRQIIDDIGSWIFVGMTEDVQLTTYCTYHNVKMGYDETVQYYDEQPEDFKTMHKQHVRWVWGFLASRKPFKKKDYDYKAKKKIMKNIAIVEYNCSLWPLVVYIVLTLVSFLIAFALFLSSFYFDISKAGWLFLHSLIPFFSVYVLFMISCIVVLIANRKQFKFSFKNNLFIVFTFGFWFFDFVSGFFDGLVHKKKRNLWTVVPHNGDVTNQELTNKK